MHIIFWILTLACPFWAIDLTLRAMQRTPPAWVGDGMAVALILLGIGLIRHALIAIKAEKAKGKMGFSGGNFNLTALDNSWEQSLPCLVHEMRNYSCSLKGNARLLRREALSESMLAPLSRLERTSDKIDTLSREFLNAVSISQVVNPKPLDIVDLVQGCIDEHFYDCYKSFKIETDGEIPTINGDFINLERIFLNLFRNSREAGAKNICIRFSPQPKGLRISIEDDGSGATEAQIDKMFTPLFTTKKDKGGTGLGLYMVKAIVESHNGSIRASTKQGSRPGVTGMVFNLELPWPVKPKNRILNWSAFLQNPNVHRWSINQWP